MATPSRDLGRPFSTASALLLALVAMVALIASFFMGPAILIILPVVSLVIVAIELFRRNAEVRQVARLAEVSHAHAPVTTWGKVTTVDGQCPTGPTPRTGDTFAIVDGKVTPPMCEHVQREILDEAARMESGEDLPDEPVTYHDVNHRVELELHREREPLTRAA